jgi:hypothetical protein
LKKVANWFNRLYIMGMTALLLIAVVLVAILLNYVLGFYLTAKRRFRAGALVDGQPVIYSGGANHYRTHEAAGGYMALTAKRLMFFPHKYNLDSSILYIDTNAIKAARPRRNFWVVPNGVTVELKDGHMERFVVYYRDRWVKQINAAVTSSRR